jgi:hypothetical protein
VDENFHDRLAEELAGEPEPPLGDLVTGALRQGRRLRFVRRAKITASALAAIALLVAGLALGGHAFGPGRVPTAAHLTMSPATPGVPPGPLVPATPAAIAYRLQQLLPGRHFTHLRHDGGVALELEFYLDTPNGPGRLNLSVTHGSVAYGCPQGDRVTTACTPGSDGMYTQVVRIPDNCIQSLSVDVDHGNGTVVQLDVSTCLDWNGTANPAGHSALTQEQAIAVASDPGLGTMMSATLVHAGNARFPSLAVP